MNEVSSENQFSKQNNTSSHPKWSDWLLAMALSLLFYGLSVLALAKVLPLISTEIAGTQKLVAANICNLNQNKCDHIGDFVEITLPHFDKEKIDSSFRKWRYELTFDLPNTNNVPQSLYFPKFSETLSIYINGKQIEAMPDLQNAHPRRWARPEIYNLPPALLYPTSNRLKIELSGYKNHWSTMLPIYVGPSHILKKQFDNRYWLTRGAARISLFLMLISSVSLGALWLARRNQTSYFWLSIASIASAINMISFSFDDVGLDIRTRLFFVFFFSAVFTLALTKFYSIFIKINLRPIIIVKMSICILYTMEFIFINNELSRYTLIFLLTAGLSSNLLLIASTLIYRRRMSFLTFTMIFSAFFAIIFFYTIDYGKFIDSSWSEYTTITQIYPIIFLIIIMTLIGEHLLNSLKQSKALGESLAEQVAEKSRELEASYVQLAESKRRQAIFEERQRIMFDLHDGIGGQLHNTLAYMKNSELEDPTIENALETSLQDLGLLVDSLGHTDSVLTLLGMFRTRIEPLMSQRDISFNWHIGDEPQIGGTENSQSLDLLRIVQEAVTNAIRHSGCTEITIYTDKHTLRVCDNGTGFTPELDRNSEYISAGVGLTSMRRRAEKIKAGFHLSSSKSGTDISLTWPDQWGEGQDRNA